MTHRTSEVDTGGDADEPPGALAESEGVTRKAVLDRLDRVTDPELDRSIVELEYIDAIDIDGSDAFVRFKLPTAWCSPTFAWMMATGIRDKGEALPGVEDVEIELIDHMHAAEINEGVNARREFEEAFEDATEGIEETRKTLDRKARLARQYRAIETLLDAGMKSAQIVSLSSADVGFAELPVPAEPRALETVGSDGSDGSVTIELTKGALYVQVPREPIAAYIQKAIETDLVVNADDPLFATPDEEPIEVSDFDLVHRRARSAHVNQSGQGGICASLHEARYGIRANEPAD